MQTCPSVEPTLFWFTLAALARHLSDSITFSASFSCAYSSPSKRKTG